jgi:flavoprotein
MKILWCITGAGEFLKESLEAMAKLHEKNDIEVFVSKAGEEVLLRYKLFRDLKKAWHIERDETASSMPAGNVTLGKYGAVVVSPASANTVAKIANGIADNLVTTAVSLALKSSIKVYIVPTDWLPKKAEIPHILVPGGGKVHMMPRKSDIRNIRMLKEEGVEVLERPEKLVTLLK